MVSLPQVFPPFISPIRTKPTAHLILKSCLHRHKSLIIYYYIPITVYIPNCFPLFGFLGQKFCVHLYGWLPQYETVGFVILPIFLPSALLTAPYTVAIIWYCDWLRTGENGSSLAGGKVSSPCLPIQTLCKDLPGFIPWATWALSSPGTRLGR